VAGKVTDLMEALRASVEAARARRDEPEGEEEGTEAEEPRAKSARRRKAG
jgi:hypothetical protein